MSLRLRWANGGAPHGGRRALRRIEAIPVIFGRMIELMHVGSKFDDKAFPTCDG